MKDRIEHIMRAKNLKASDFAALLGIQPSGVSHILAGRNKPSLEFVKKIKETFPEYNLDWIIFGTGPMTTSEPFNVPTTPSSNSSSPDPGSIPFDFDDEPLQDDLSVIDPTDVSEKVMNSNTIKSMVVLYDDGTFENYSPR
ncbi:MAG: helix-turn-helix transcriptional regulator [Bacteroidales bacterium]|nr:helix-turn-helix transcriptional regulator [Bacteroidales bacterium]